MLIVFANGCLLVLLRQAFLCFVLKNLHYKLLPFFTVTLQVEMVCHFYFQHVSMSLHPTTECNCLAFL